MRPQGENGRFLPAQLTRKPAPPLIVATIFSPVCTPVSAIRPVRRSATITSNYCP